MEILAKLQIWSYEIDQTCFLVSDEYESAAEFFEEEAAPIAASVVGFEQDGQSILLEKLNSGELTPKADYDPKSADQVWYVHMDVYYGKVSISTDMGGYGEYECGTNPSSNAIVGSVESATEDIE